MSKFSGLQLLVDKEPVVGTHVGIFDDESAENTYTRYHSETETFVVSPDITRYQRQFIQKITDKQTTIGCIVAPFGYGKTSTAINIWNACDEAELLAIPPFSCNSIAEMGQAITTAVVHKLEKAGKRELAEQVEDAFSQYLTSSARRMAEKDAEAYGIDIDVAQKSIEDKIKSGHLQVQASANHLISFLEYLVKITCEAGYKGLVIIIDEFQQFLGNINKNVVTNFRTLIWGLQTRGDLPLGFLITMDPDTERNLTERGADILHRIRDHNLYITFASVYDREFPRELWSRYAQSFGFVENSVEIVDHATLEAIGQICERADLSNGPRTVIDTFQRIATLHASRERPYSPIDLIDDFLTGDIRFDGDRGKIASLVNEITSYDYIRKLQERVEVIKLIAAFPRGCPHEVAEKYAIQDTFDYLSDELRGEILVELPEGIALTDLQKVGKPPNKLNIILKKYWLQITEKEIISDKALQYFSEYGVDPMFSEYVSHQNGWKHETDRFLLTPRGGYFRVYEGTFFEEYPYRRIAVQVCFDVDHVVMPDGYVDAQFVFLIQTDDAEKPQAIDTIDGIPSYVIPIAIHKPYTRSLPRNIREIENFLSPVVLTPGVLISLLNYISEQVPKIEGISEREHQRIMSTHAQLQSFLLTETITEDVFQPYGIQIFTRGSQAFRDALFNILRDRYPHYQTLVNGSGWRKTLEQYINVLRAIDPTHRRGIEYLAGSKQELAMYFDQKQYAGFESYAKQYHELLEVVSWKGNTGEIAFHRHTQENNLIEAISLETSLTEQELADISRTQGYLYDETAYLIDILLLRGYIEHQEDHQIVLASTFTQDELIRLAREMLEQIGFIQGIPSGTDLNELLKSVKSALMQLENKTADLSDVQVRLLQHQRQLQEQCEAIILHLRNDMQEVIERMYQYLATLDQPLPESSTDTFLDSHINGAQRNLQKKTGSVSKRIEKHTRAIRETLEQSVNIDVQDFTQFKKYVSQVQKHFQNIEKERENIEFLLAQCDTHHEWVQLVDRLKRLADMADAATEITDTSLLQKNIETLQWNIQQELASEGLKQYRAIYERFHGDVKQIQRELETLSRLARTQNETATDVKASEVQPHTVAPAVHYDRDTEHEIANSASPIDLRLMFEQSSKTSSEFLDHLIKQSEMGEIAIYHRK
jgi:hypothetical protein